METNYSYRVNGSWEVRRNGLLSAEGVEKPRITFHRRSNSKARVGIGHLSISSLQPLFRASW
jgi:hypothetical protein